MYLVNRRVGFFRKRVQQQQSQSMMLPVSISSPMANSPQTQVPEEGKFMYFFISNSRYMYYDENWFKVRSLINEGKTVEEIEAQMIKKQFRKLDLRRYTLSTQIGNHPFEDNFPFINRLCFEMVSITGQLTSLFIFAQADEPDLQDLFNLIHHLEVSKKDALDPPALLAHATSIIQDKLTQQKNNQQFFQRIVQSYEEVNTKSKQENGSEQLQKSFEYAINQPSTIEEQDNSENMQENQTQQLSEDITYSGQMRDNKPHGSGMEFSSNDGVQYKGNYRDGNRHGPGSFVDSNLEMYSYEYIMGRPVGI